MEVAGIAPLEKMTGNSFSRAIQTDRYHLIYNAYWQVPFTPVDFYKKNDPYELENLIDRPDLADIQEDLIARLAEWMILERDFLPLPAGGN